MGIFRANNRRKRKAKASKCDDASSRPNKLACVFKCLSLEPRAESILAERGHSPLPDYGNANPHTDASHKWSKSRLDVRKRQYFIGDDEEDVEEVGVGKGSEAFQELGWLSTSFENPDPPFQANNTARPPSSSRAAEPTTSRSSTPLDSNWRTECDGFSAVLPHVQPVFPGRDVGQVHVLLDRFEALTEKRAVSVSRLQASGKEADALANSVKEARGERTKLDVRVSDLNNELRSLEFHRKTVTARCERLERELRLRKDDGQRATRVRESQKGLLNGQVAHLRQAQTYFETIREQKMGFCMVSDVACKCLREDLWGLHKMYTGLSEEKEEQAKELQRLQTRLEEDVKDRERLENNLSACQKRHRDCLEEEKRMKKEMKDALQSLEEEKAKLDERTKEVFELQKWAKDAEVENARMKAETAAAEREECLLREQILPMLKDMNHNIPTLENGLLNISSGLGGCSSEDGNEIFGGGHVRSRSNEDQGGPLACKPPLWGPLPQSLFDSEPPAFESKAAIEPSDHRQDSDVSDIPKETDPNVLGWSPEEEVLKWTGGVQSGPRIEEIDD